MINHFDILKEDVTALITSVRSPHPIPYQGSKRSLAPQILALIEGRRFRRFYEPFAGSAAITIAAASIRLADEYVIGDILKPLVDIWEQILVSPHRLADEYEKLWLGQLSSDENYFYRVRDQYNRSPQPDLLLYLLARCVKNALRFNQQGEFNQSYDKRRLGTQPQKMRREILVTSELLARRTRAVCVDFASIVMQAEAEDIVYMDPPYEGTSTGVNKRYYQGLERNQLITALANLNQRGVPFLLSYDGRCGIKTYGSALPEYLGLTRLELNAGRSSQSTLNGEADETIESLYVSHNLMH